MRCVIVIILENRYGNSILIPGEGFSNFTKRLYLSKIQDPKIYFSTLDKEKITMVSSNLVWQPV